MLLKIFFFPLFAGKCFSSVSSLFHFTKQPEWRVGSSGLELGLEMTALFGFSGTAINCGA